MLYFYKYSDIYSLVVQLEKPDFIKRPDHLTFNDPNISINKSTGYIQLYKFALQIWLKMSVTMLFYYFLKQSLCFSYHKVCVDDIHIHSPTQIWISKIALNVSLAY